jgi:hypothetical protein
VISCLWILETVLVLMGRGLIELMRRIGFVCSSMVSHLDHLVRGNIGIVQEPG